MSIEHSFLGSIICRRQRSLVMKTQRRWLLSQSTALHWHRQQHKGIVQTESWCTRQQQLASLLFQTGHQSWLHEGSCLLQKCISHYSFALFKQPDSVRDNRLAWLNFKFEMKWILNSNNGNTETVWLAQKHDTWSIAGSDADCNWCRQWGACHGSGGRGHWYGCVPYLCIIMCPRKENVKSIPHQIWPIVSATTF